MIAESIRTGRTWLWADVYSDTGQVRTKVELECRAQGRQLVRHGHLTVNGKKVNIPSYIVKPGDVIEIRESSRNNLSILGARDATAHTPSPSWLEVDRENMRARVVNPPKREDLVQIQLNEQLIVELYSK